MFIFVMLFMFCVGVLSVKANCQYYDENGDLMVEFDYIPVGTEFRKGQNISINTYNAKLYYSIFDKEGIANYSVSSGYRLIMRSEYNYVVTENNYCPENIVFRAYMYKNSYNDNLSRVGYAIYLEPDNIESLYNSLENNTGDYFVANIQDENYYYTFVKEGVTVKNIVNNVEFRSTFYYVGIGSSVVESDVSGIFYRLITYSDGTYGLCVNDKCEDFNSFSNIPTLTVNGKEFTVASSAAEELFSLELTGAVQGIVAYFRRSGNTIYLSNSLSAEGGLNPGGEDIDVPLDVTPVTFCEEKGVQKTFQVIGYILFVAKIIIPLILIILGSIDFAKATISSDEKAPKDAIMALARRIIIAIIIFLIPTILNFLLSLVNGASEAFNDSNFTDCTNCLFDPFGNECQPGNPWIE